MKPFNLDENNIMWDQIWNAEDVEIKFVIPKGSTFHERMQAWHLTSLEASKACRIDMNERKIGELKLFNISGEL